MSQLVVLCINVDKHCQPNYIGIGMNNDAVNDDGEPNLELDHGRVLAGDQLGSSVLPPAQLREPSEGSENECLYG